MANEMKELHGAVLPPPTFEQNGKEMLCHRLLVIGC